MIKILLTSVLGAFRCMKRDYGISYCLFFCCSCCLSTYPTPTKVWVSVVAPISRAVIKSENTIEGEMKLIGHKKI